jgi:hypothetical protein
MAADVMPDGNTPLTSARGSRHVSGQTMLGGVRVGPGAAAIGAASQRSSPSALLRPVQGGGSMALLPGRQWCGCGMSTVGGAMSSPVCAPPRLVTQTQDTAGAVAAAMVARGPSPTSRTRIASVPSSPRLVGTRSPSSPALVGARFVEIRRS